MHEEALDFVDFNWDNNLDCEEYQNDKMTSNEPFYIRY